MNFSLKEDDVEACCHVKIHDKWIMKFTTALKIENTENNKIALLCKGEYFPISQSKQSEIWIGNKHNSMDYVDIRNAQIGWQHMTNIQEPVCLIHDCVSINHIKTKLPKYIKKKHNLILQQNIIYWNYKIHREHHQQQQRRLAANEAKIQLPCGPVYRCQHGHVQCHECERINPNIVENVNFKLKWYCNSTIHPYFWIFDAANGYVIGAMKPTHSIDNAIYED
jgi:hypothetical protein